MTKGLFVVAAAMLAASPSLQAKSSQSDLKWGPAPPALPAGAQMAVVSGDPTKAGMFTVQVKFPADYAVPAHWHPTDEKLTILSGKLGYGMSSKLDKAKAKTLTAGQHVVMKAKMNHWVFAETPVEFQLNARGPFQVTYVDPKDDPRKK
ncbi:cupin domain-containing protein [Sphingomonas sp.]|uniref:cupin domain-containing protein n=1 Tax=Sphingomonas sp. TaxID=28214 RepID=UPI0025F8E943|nr:cupin domain-containing protein [Sphingomonas sp.]MBV9528124.1 cupin domain-containing protein [Sphingomonas sp.]